MKSKNWTPERIKEELPDVPAIYGAVYTTGELYDTSLKDGYVFLVAECKPKDAREVSLASVARLLNAGELFVFRE